MPGDAVRIVIEVASATLAHDLGCKQRVYARASGTEYRVVDVNARFAHQM